MTEMVERVARAICEANGDDPDKEYPVTLTGLVMSVGNWQKQWELVQPLARAAIAAMREPTDEMTAAGAARTSDLLRAGTSTGYVVLETFIAMIDAALGAPS